ncbi:MAG: hypothetical protein H6696_10205 [Deferribacteres bacterium]|nr:hypothetical protein [candidate division KSB1 bacterium]MCB9502301.1 hypothetical protein [Deferribacteres bacterium]
MLEVDQRRKALNFGQKLEIIVRLINRQSLLPFFDTLDSSELVDAHNFLWDTMLTIHSRTQSHEFRRDEVTKKMISSAQYQKMQGCDLRIDYCKGVECIWSNPECAGKKIKANLDIIAQQIMKYFNQAEIRN